MVGVSFWAWPLLQCPCISLSFYLPQRPTGLFRAFPVTSLLPLLKPALHYCPTMPGWARPLLLVAEHLLCNLSSPSSRTSGPTLGPFLTSSTVDFLLGSLLFKSTCSSRVLADELFNRFRAISCEADWNSCSTRVSRDLPALLVFLTPHPRSLVSPSS